MTGRARVATAPEVAVSPSSSAASPPDPESQPRPLSLVVELAGALQRAGVLYCHFKSNEALDRSLRGENDLDLLVGVEGVSRFSEVLARLGFKETRPGRGREIPGVTHHYGLDRPTGVLVHVHAHRHLVLGDHTTKNVRLGAEDAYLVGTDATGVLPVPRAAHELALFALRMVLKHGPLDAIAMGQGRLSASERRELTWLLERADRRGVEAFLRRAVASVDPALFDRCLRAIAPGASVATRARTAGRLHRALATRARRGRVADALLRTSRRASWGARRLLRGPARKRPAGGGSLVAVAGGDGAGKSTAVRHLAGWLSGPFAVSTVHLGKPPAHLATLAVKGPLVVLRRLGLVRDTRVPSHRIPDGRVDPPGVVWLLWDMCTARDRFLAFRRARRRALSGRIVVADRIPLPTIHRMDGPRLGWVASHPRAGRLARVLAAREAWYHARIGPPDVLVVLRADPEVAVRRTAGTDEPGFVRARATEVLRADWSGTGAVVIDAGRPGEDVLAAIRDAVWARL